MSSGELFGDSPLERAYPWELRIQILEQIADDYKDDPQGEFHANMGYLMMTFAYEKGVPHRYAKLITPIPVEFPDPGL